MRSYQSDAPKESDASATGYAFGHWPSHVRGGTCRDFGDELVRELIWLTGDDVTLWLSYTFGPSSHENGEDIIILIHSLVVCFPCSRPSCLCARLTNLQ